MPNIPQNITGVCGRQLAVLE